MSDESDDHIPVRLTRLETNVNRLTDDVKALTKLVGENIQSQSEIIHSLSEKVVSSAIPNWQTWGGFIAVIVTSIAVIFTMIEFRSDALEKDILHNNELTVLRDEIVFLKIRNEQNLVDNNPGNLY